MAYSAIPGTGLFYVGADGMVKYKVTMQDTATMDTREEEIDTGKSAEEAGIQPGITYNEEGQAQTNPAQMPENAASGTDEGYNEINAFTGGANPGADNYASPQWGTMTPGNYMHQGAGYNVTPQAGQQGTQGIMGQPGGGASMNTVNNQLVAPGSQIPGAAPTGALGTPGSSMVTQPGGRPGVDTQAARANTLFNPDDPNGLMASVMRDMGLNPVGFGNPFIQFIKRAAPGLAMAFNIANAQQPGVTAQTQADNPYAARDFVKNAMGSGSVMSTLGQAAGQLPALAQQIKGLGLGADTDTSTINPFLWSVANMMNQGFGEGTINMLTALLGPSMPSTLRAGYQTGLQSSLGNAQYNYDWENAGKPGAKTIWDYILSSAAQ